jgi:hypothetical protein
MQLPEVPLFNGLRVRMGVVTGEVPSGTALKNSALFQLAKGTGRPQGLLRAHACVHDQFVCVGKLCAAQLSRSSTLKSC